MYGWTYICIIWGIYEYACMEVCICMYIGLYNIWMDVCMYVCNVCMYVCIVWVIYEYACMEVCMCVCIYVPMDEGIYERMIEWTVSMYVCMYVMYVWMYVWLGRGMYIYVRIHVHKVWMDVYMYGWRYIRVCMYVPMDESIYEWLLKWTVSNVCMSAMLGLKGWTNFIPILHWRGCHKSATDEF
jgi:hypothetical protein